jgi:hypothetical protein
MTMMLESSMHGLVWYSESVVRTQLFDLRMLWAAKEIAVVAWLTDDI